MLTSTALTIATITTLMSLWHNASQTRQIVGRAGSDGKARPSSCPGPTLRGVPEHTASKLVSEKKSITHASDTRALAKLREMGAPGGVVGSVERRLMPPPERLRGVVTHNLHGPAMAEQRKRTKQGLRYGKTKTYEALQRSGLAPKDIRRRTGVGRETVRKALYERCGRRAAKCISEALGEALGLSDDEREAIRGELMRSPRKNA